MSLKKAAEQVRAQGRGKDTELVHLTKPEVAGLHALARVHGGKLTKNPQTGLTEAGFLNAILPTLVGVALGATGVGIPLAMAGGALAGAATGDKKNGVLMNAGLGALGGYGGAGLAGGLTGMAAGTAAGNAAAIGGAEATQQAAMLAAQEAGMQGVGSATQAEMLALQNAGMGSDALSRTAQAAGTSALDSAPGTMQAGLGAAWDNPGAYVKELGGGEQAMKYAGAAVAPALMQSPEAAEEEADSWDPRKYRYDANYTGGVGGGGSSEKTWFNPKYTRTLAEGGEVGMEDGGFVIPADVAAYAGGGSSNAGLAALSQHVGAKPIRGPGNGLSDSIPANIGGKQRAAVADSEAYVPAAKVAKIGGGDQKRGAQKLYAMMDRVRKQATGSTKQVRPVNLKKAMA
jgi:hypothetical protein